MLLSNCKCNTLHSSRQNKVNISTKETYNTIEIIGDDFSCCYATKMSLQFQFNNKVIMLFSADK